MNGRQAMAAVCLLAAGCILFFPAITRSQDQREFTESLAISIGWRANGTALEPVVQTAGEVRTFSSAIPIRSGHWRTYFKNINFDFTPDAIGNSAAIKKVMTKYLNKRFGNANVAKFGVTTVQIPVKPLSSFGNNLIAYRMQFDFDHHNEIIMTADDQFFRNLQGQLENPTLVAWTKLFLYATITLKNGMWVGVFTIEEADIWLRSDFFTQSVIAQQTLLSGSLRAALGYQKTAWIHDFHADVKTISSAMFKNGKSAPWALAKELDNLFYTDPVSTAAYLSTPRALPLDNGVIDLKDYKLPSTDAANPLPLLDVPALFLTNLKAYETGKNLTIVISFTPPGPVGTAAKKKKIVTLSGAAHEYPLSFNMSGTITPWYPRIILNYVLLGRADDLAKLRDAIAQYGTPLQVEGASFNKALKCDVAISGYLEEKGSLKKLVRTVWFTDSSL